MVGSDGLQGVFQDRPLDLTYVSLEFSSTRLRWPWHLLRGDVVRSKRSQVENKHRELCVLKYRKAGEGTGQGGRDSPATLLPRQLLAGKARVLRRQSELDGGGRV